MIFWLLVGVMEMMVWSFTMKGFKQVRSRHRHQEKEVPTPPKLWMNMSPLIYSHHYHIYHHHHLVSSKGKDWGLGQQPYDERLRTRAAAL